MKYQNYQKPVDILYDNDLERSQKLDFLRKWKEDEEALSRANSEGLNGGEPQNLKAVTDALIALENNQPPSFSHGTADQSKLRSTLEHSNLDSLAKQADAALGHSE